MLQATKNIQNYQIITGKLGRNWILPQLIRVMFLTNKTNSQNIIVHLKVLQHANM